MYRGYVLNDLNGFNDSSFTIRITFIRNRNYRRCILMHPWAISDIQGLTRAVLHSGPSGTLSSCIATWSDIGSCQAEDRGYWELNPHFGDAFQTLTISNHGLGQTIFLDRFKQLVRCICFNSMNCNIDIDEYTYHIYLMNSTYYMVLRVKNICVYVF